MSITLTDTQCQAFKRFVEDEELRAPSDLRVLIEATPTEGEVKESELWRWLRDELTVSYKSIDLQRVESGSTSEGIPDVNYCLQGVEGWIELKVAKLTKRPPYIITIGLRPAQAFWLARRRRAGGRAWVLAAIPPMAEVEGRWGHLLLFDGVLAPRMFQTDGSFSLDDARRMATADLPKERGPQLKALFEHLTKPL